MTARRALSRLLLRHALALMDHPVGIEDAAVYLEAARRIGEGEEEFSCCAIALVTGKYDAWNEHQYKIPILERYSARFSEYEGSLIWLGAETNRQDIRCITLCFAAAMAEAGDL